jgi:cytoskeletal protein CcmA (bactofilin family)
LPKKSVHGKIPQSFRGVGVKFSGGLRVRKFRVSGTVSGKIVSERRSDTNCLLDTEQS